MENTYNYLKTVFQNLKNNQNYSFVFIILVLWCIPLSYVFNSIALTLLAGFTLYNFKKRNFKIEKTLLIPIVLFLLMAISILWSRDISGTFKAISKGLPLLLFPLCFFVLTPFTREQKQKIFLYFSYGMIAYTLFYLIKAFIRFTLTQNKEVFFYHELVTNDVNAIHVSLYIALAIFFLLTKSKKTILEIIGIFLMTIMLMLLSSKNIIFLFFILIIGGSFLKYKTSPKATILKLGSVLILLLVIAFNGKIKNRFLSEYMSNKTENTLNYEIGSDTEKVYNISMRQAWTQDQFKPNDFFGGTAFRVYQIRIFNEMLREDPIFFTGYGLNATDKKISEKRIQHNLYKGYEDKNFHNEYIQIFAELGVFGFIILLIMILVNLINAIKSKDFLHISFAVLMISLFLTESFLSRQRGIVFFTMFYCLLNSENLNVSPNNAIKE